MLVAAFMLVISVAAMVQFAVFSWRAGLLRIAAEPLANQATDSSNNLLNQNDFADASSIQKLCPELSTDSGPSLMMVQFYHSLMSGLDSLAAAMMPAGSNPMAWTRQEMALCTRYSNVVLSRRLQVNQLAANQLRSF